ncbi:type IV secretory system conjugative DNA transfer family protein [Longispora albida]|uniref:type IV secretory system conjugative DNA transfer family protein n=1 Tax=Longispora albida TaxID=203523 RepID=UPI00058D8AD3|nr:type IV secretory system conjugative DNA transfer family protein [Longispora albida]
MTSPALAPLPEVRVQFEDRVFLGWDKQDRLQPVWSAREDSVGLIGPPRYGKSSGLIIPNLLTWPGPAVCTSTRGDLLAKTGNWRRRVAHSAGGNVLIYDPLGSEYPEHSMRWSPLAGCADPAVCYRRVAALTAVSGQGVKDGDHWRAGAAGILRGYFHAAALERLPMSVVRRWLAGQETRDPVAILRLSGSPGAIWADDLESIRILGEQERGSFFSVARNTLEALAEPTVLRSCDATDLDVDKFLHSRSTLYIIGPSHVQQAIAPLVAGLVDSIAQRAAELAAEQGGRLAQPLLLALDEVANIAPIQSLPALVSEGGGRGIVTMWAVQSLAQLRDRYGVEKQAAILAATTAKVVYGGMSHGPDLANVSGWAGEERQNTSTFQAGGSSGGVVSAAPGALGGPGFQGQGPGSVTVSELYRPALPVNAIQQLPPLHAWLFWRSDRHRLVDTRPAGLIPEFRALEGFTP